MSPRAVQSSWLTVGGVPFTSVDTHHTEVLRCPTCPPCSTCPPLPTATPDTAGPFTVCMVLYWTHTACVLLVASFTLQCAPKCPPRPVFSLPSLGLLVGDTGSPPGLPMGLGDSLHSTCPRQAPYFLLRLVGQGGLFRWFSCWFSQAVKSVTLLSAQSSGGSWHGGAGTLKVSRNELSPRLRLDRAHQGW